MHKIYLCQAFLFTCAWAQQSAERSNSNNTINISIVLVFLWDPVYTK